jgi:hypothetical protein
MFESRRVAHELKMVKMEKMEKLRIVVNFIAELETKCIAERSGRRAMREVVTQMGRRTNSVAEGFQEDIAIGLESRKDTRTEFMRVFISLYALNLEKAMKHGRFSAMTLQLLRNNRG